MLVKMNLLKSGKDPFFLGKHTCGLILGCSLIGGCGIGLLVLKNLFLMSERDKALQLEIPILVRCSIFFVFLFFFRFSRKNSGAGANWTGGVEDKCILIKEITREAVFVRLFNLFCSQ